MSDIIAVAFGLLTALSNAIAVMFQHVASTSGDHRGWSWFRHVVRHPLWLLGWGGMLGSLVFQSVALHAGPMSLVQPLLVSELVIALIMRRVWRRQRLTPAAWISASATSVALATLLVVTHPRGVTISPGATRWVVSDVVCLALVGLLVLLARRASPVRRAAAFATATALLWALEATFIKSATDSLVTGGVVGLLRSWSLYAMILVGVAGLTTEQLALRVGPLSVSQPLIVIVDPLASVLLGVSLFRDQIAHGIAALAVAALAFLVMSVGVVAMTRAVPETLLPSTGA